MHARGVVHRDVRGDNILTLPDGTVLLIDFAFSCMVSYAGGGIVPAPYVWYLATPIAHHPQAHPSLSLSLPIRTHILPSQYPLLPSSDTWPRGWAIHGM